MKKREPSISRAFTRLKKKSEEFFCAKGHITDLLQRKCEFEVSISQFSDGSYQVMDREQDYNFSHVNTGVDIEDFIEKVKKLKKGEKLETPWH